MPVLGLPLALIGLVALPALAAIYVLRTRYRRRTVSTLLLWNAVAQATGGGRKANRLQTPWVLLLELLALLLLVLAAAAPRFLASGQRAAAIVVLDDSWSMRAEVDGDRSARDAGVKAVLEELAGLGRFTAGFVLAGDKPVRLTETARDATEVRDALTAWRASSVSSDLPAAIALARETGGPGTRVLVVSDRLPEAAGERSPSAASEREDEAGTPQVLPPSAAVDTEQVEDVRWRAVGVAQANAGVVRAVRSAGNGGRDVLMVEVGHYGPGTAERSVEVRVDLWRGEPDEASANRPLELRPNDWSTLHRGSVSVAPGTTERLWFERPKAMRDGGLLRVTTSMPGDALAADDVAYLADRPVKPVKVATQIADTNLRRSVIDALNATGIVELVSDAGLAEVFVSEQTIGGSNLANSATSWNLVLFRPGESLASRPYAGPFLLDRTHRLMQGVSLSNVVWSAVGEPDIETAWSGAEVLASAGQIPLIGVRGGEDPERTILLNLDPARSTLLQSVAWPVLMSNVVNARMDARPGLSTVNAQLGVPIDLSVASEPLDDAQDDESSDATGVAEVRRLRGLGGRAIDAETPVSIPLRENRATWMPSAPGVYAVKLPGNESRFVSVAGWSAAESDLSGAGRGEAGVLNADVMSRPEYRSLGWLLGLVALGLLAVEAYVLRGGRAGLSKSSAPAFDHRSAVAA